MHREHYLSITPSVECEVGTSEQTALLQPDGSQMEDVEGGPWISFQPLPRLYLKKDIH